MVATKRYYFAFIGALTAVAIFSATIGQAHADTLHIDTSNSHAYTIKKDAFESLSTEEQAILERDTEILFTRYIQLNAMDMFEVNDDILAADGYQSSIIDLHHLADTLNAIPWYTPESHLFNPSQRNTKPMGVGEFAVCVVLNGLGLPAVSNKTALIAAIKGGIKAWNWGLTARTVARILGPSVAKALGGPVAISITLGIAAWTCRGEL